MDIFKETGFRITIFMSVTALVILHFLASFSIVQPYERGVRTSLGQIQGTQSSGVSYAFWPVQSLHKYDITNQVIEFKDETALSSATKDLQDVQVSMTSNYHLDANSIEKIYLNYGDTYTDLILKPIVIEGVKSAASQFTAEELVTKRLEFVAAAEKNISKRMIEVSSVLEKVSITNLKFSDSFNSAIENKVRAQQEAGKAENELKKAKFEADSKIVAAKAEAETIRIQAEAIQSQGGAEYVNLKAVEKWNGVLPTNFVPGSALPFLNIK